MPKFSYIGQQYTQGKSPLELITFCADASDVYRWGGVPSKNQSFHGGFQRALNSRYQKIVSYFNNGQASPGAIVIAFRTNTLNVTNLGLPNAWPNRDLTSTPNFVHIEFESEDDQNLDLQQLISRVRVLVEQRPGFASMSADAQVQEDSSDDSDISSVSQESDESEEDDIDVGESKLRIFYDFIGDQNRIDDWIKREEERIRKIKEKKSPSKEEREEIKLTPREKLEETLKSLIRPAMIVDGQHRINGANESQSEGIIFTICAIKDADWVEQVFQFVVLNKMAKPISKDFLTELLNSSLTNDEILDIDSRLETIGIKNADRKIYKLVNHHPDSPFMDLVAEASEVSGSEKVGRLSQQGMLSLARRWVNISGAKKTSEIQCFQHYLNAKNLGEARSKWSENDQWSTLFFAFWAEVKALYAPQQIWVKQEKYHLLYIVTLQAMQDHFIQVKASAMVKFTDLEDFRNQVREFFTCVPSTFFQNWTVSGLQSGNGWEWIKEALKMFQDGQRLPSVQRDSKLFS